MFQGRERPIMHLASLVLACSDTMVMVPLEDQTEVKLGANECSTGKATKHEPPSTFPHICAELSKVWPCIFTTLIRKAKVLGCVFFFFFKVVLKLPLKLQ
ncbi:neutrophil cytosol factor 1 [Platysternon megacephalum]|uniref:Neutrophil cytosol factor 1 n=1 Tax=Platysternon megacephalum TaxID=55544 RepID=A0A4D9F236_9SAUR|nr:neutrophil cytosol factor 1 [Platysternon megacephalum]